MPKIMLIFALFSLLLGVEDGAAPPGEPTVEKDAFLAVTYLISTPGNVVGSVVVLELQVRNISDKSVFLNSSSDPLASLDVSLKNRIGQVLRHTQFLDLVQSGLSAVTMKEIKPGGVHIIHVPIWRLFDHSMNGAYTAKVTVFYRDANETALSLIIPEFSYALNEPERTTATP